MSDRDRATTDNPTSEGEEIDSGDLDAELDALGFDPFGMDNEEGR